MVWGRTRALQRRDGGGRAPQLPASSACRADLDTSGRCASPRSGSHLCPRRRCRPPLRGRKGPWHPGQAPHQGSALDRRRSTAASSSSRTALRSSRSSRRRPSTDSSRRRRRSTGSSSRSTGSSRSSSTGSSILSSSSNRASSSIPSSSRPRAWTQARGTPRSLRGPKRTRKSGRWPRSSLGWPRRSFWDSSAWACIAAA
mmetsp:Transcript_81334/g.242394  ORF Transcript_81334/g.242394 Transcript_81334/m.242394 type:complete len:200 (+) Transcript_81334:331-930(+)